MEKGRTTRGPGLERRVGRLVGRDERGEEGDGSDREKGGGRELHRWEEAEGRACFEGVCEVRERRRRGVEPRGRVESGGGGKREEGKEKEGRRWKSMQKEGRGEAPPVL